MPTNVTIEYLKAEDEYRDAKGDPERLLALEKMLSTIPKHKGTEKMVLQIKRKIAKLKKDIEQKEAKKGGGKGFNIRKEGAAQIVLVGPPNAGKSSILKSLTNADVAVGAYAFTTLELTPGMLQINDIQIQLVEVPGLIEGVSVGKGMGLQLLSSVRSADALVLVIDASNDPVGQMEVTLKELDSGGIKLNRARPDIDIKKKVVGGIEIVGKEHINADLKDVKEILIDFRVSSGLLVVREDVTLADIQEALEYSTAYKRGFVILNKFDMAEPSILSKMKKRFPRFPFYAVSTLNGKGLREVAEKIYEIAEIKRIFTKSPGEDPAYPPVAMKRDATVMDVAKKVHKTIARNFKYARVWGSSVKFGGQRVGEDHVPGDGDTVEIHIK
ncbi:MAG TPA: 50S ribosome-binding GTPase [Candidatus Methanofastidiosa archaeon]|nr:50S ribosome-binding GTPase [Candidatus Methanofastidiosa archaeon]